MMIALLIGGGLVAAFYGLALCRAAWHDDEREPVQTTQISYRWMVDPPRWTTWAPTRQTVAIRSPRRRQR